MPAANTPCRCSCQSSCPSTEHPVVTALNDVVSVTTGGVIDLLSRRERDGGCCVSPFAKTSPANGDAAPLNSNAYRSRDEPGRKAPATTFTSRDVSSTPG